MTLPNIKPDPDYQRFVKILSGEVKPKRPPFAELFLDTEHMIGICEEGLRRKWVPSPGNREERARHYDNVIAVYHALGYDYVRVTGNHLDFSSKYRRSKKPGIDGKIRNWTEEDAGLITTREEFEAYEWPQYRDEDAWDFEYVSTHLPDGMGMVVCPAGGFLEVPLNNLMGYTALCYALTDDPELVSDVFDEVGRRIYDYYEHVAKLNLPNLFGFFQGDDMGYKGATLISPDDTRRLALKWHKRTAQSAHDYGLIYMLHSCGNLDSIMEDLIEDVKIDAKHSFEDAIMPVTDFHERYSSRIGVLGGVDVDAMCRYEPPALRKYIRGVLDACMPGGRYALGSGNSVANYVPISNYFVMLDEGWYYGG